MAKRDEYAVLVSGHGACAGIVWHALAIEEQGCKEGGAQGGVPNLACRLT